MKRRIWAHVECRTREQARAVQTALKDPQVFAFAIIMGSLLPLKSKRAQARVLRFIDDHLRDTS